MIQINNVTKSYKDAVILEHASYSFPQNGVVCLMGASGGGKTTLLNLIAGFDTDYAGEIKVGGTAINELSADELCSYRKDNIGFVFQNYHLLPGCTVLENIMLPCELTEEPFEDSRKKAVSLLAKLGVAEKEAQKVENLSGGQKQRVAIARALMSDPQILFADEPTGALDRAASTEIMGLLSEIAKDRLVVVITHDPKIEDFADEVICIKDKNIVVRQAASRANGTEKPLRCGAAGKANVFAMGARNFRVHRKRYLAVSLAISVGVLAFLFSLSFGNVAAQSISEFQEKNTAFNNGYIKGANGNKIFTLLNEDNRVENLYRQYMLKDVDLSANGLTEHMAEKIPMPKATESMSYGVMPRLGKNEIALTPSLAKKFSADIKSLLGTELSLELQGHRLSLSVSGIYNAGYDDFFVSSDIERGFYTDLPEQEVYSISYDVKNFTDITAVSDALKQQGIDSKNAAEEVRALQNTFQSLSKLFLVISVLILAIGLFICAVLLFKLQNMRYHEVGLLSALGFQKKQIASVIFSENVLLSVLATAVNLVFLGGGAALCRLISFPLNMEWFQFAICVAATFVVVISLSAAASLRLLRTEPASALKK